MPWDSRPSRRGARRGPGPSPPGPRSARAAARRAAATPLAAPATSGAAPGDAGLLSGLVNTSGTMGGSLGLAAMPTIVAAHTAGRATPVALTEGYALAFRASAVVLLGGTVLMAAWLPRPPRPARKVP